MGYELNFFGTNPGTMEYPGSKKSPVNEMSKTINIRHANEPISDSRPSFGIGLPEAKDMVEDASIERSWCSNIRACVTPKLCIDRHTAKYIFPRMPRYEECAGCEIGKALAYPNIEIEEVEPEPIVKRKYKKNRVGSKNRIGTDKEVESTPPISQKRGNKLHLLVIKK